MRNTVVLNLDHHNQFSAGGKLADGVFIQSNYYQSGITREREKIKIYKFSLLQNTHDMHSKFSQYQLNLTIVKVEFLLGGK